MKRWLNYDKIGRESKQWIKTNGLFENRVEISAGRDMTGFEDLKRRFIQEDAGKAAMSRRLASASRFLVEWIAATCEHSVWRLDDGEGPDASRSTVRAEKSTGSAVKDDVAQDKCFKIRMDGIRCERSNAYNG